MQNPISVQKKHQTMSKISSCAVCDGAILLLPPWHITRREVHTFIVIAFLRSGRKPEQFLFKDIVLYDPIQKGLSYVDFDKFAFHNLGFVTSNIPVERCLVGSGNQRIGIRKRRSIRPISNDHRPCYSKRDMTGD